MEYRLSVRRPFSPFWRTYLIVGHKTEVFGSTGRLVLTFQDGTVIAVPGIHRKFVKVYPEFQRTQSKQIPSSLPGLIQEE